MSVSRYAKQGQASLPPDVVRKIIYLRTRHLKLGGIPVSMDRISKLLKISSATVYRWSKTWDQDPSAVRKYCGDEGPLEPGYAELRDKLLKSIEELFKFEGYIPNDYYRRAWALQDKEPECLICMPRGSGKSKALVHARIKQLILRSAVASEMVQRGETPPRGWIPNVTIQLICADGEAAKLHGAAIRAFLERGSIVKAFGSFKGKTWKANELIIRQRTVTTDDPTLLCVGIGSKRLTGRHPNYIFFDDLVTEDNTKTPYALSVMAGLISKKIQGMKVAAIGVGQTKVCWTNTPYRPNDPISEMIKASQGEAVEIQGVAIPPMPAMIVPAITHRKTGRIPSSFEEVKNKPHLFESYWPQFIPLQRGLRLLDAELVPGLLDIWLKDFGPGGQRGSFEANYLMDTSKLNSTMIDVSLIKEISREMVPPAKELEIYGFLDAAWSKKAKRISDFSCLPIVGFHRRTGRFYILRIARTRGSMLALRGMIRALFAEWSPRKIWVEKTSLYDKDLRALIYESDESGEDLARLPWIGFQPKGKKGQNPKMARAYSLENEVTMGRVFAVCEEFEGWWKIAKDEIALFPMAKNDDIFDALCQLIQRILRADNKAPDRQSSEKPRTVGVYCGPDDETRLTERSFN